jgi:hypothetical protein
LHADTAATRKPHQVEWPSVPQPVIKGSQSWQRGITNTNKRKCKQIRITGVKFSEHHFNAHPRKFKSIQSFSALDTVARTLGGKAYTTFRCACVFFVALMSHEIHCGESLCANHPRIV